MELGDIWVGVERLVKMTEEREKPGCILKQGSRGYYGLTLTRAGWTFSLCYIN